MRERINDKIIEIDGYLEQLESVLPRSFKEYKDDWKIKDICERRFEKIIEAIINLCFYVIKLNRYDSPEGDQEAIQLLADKGIIEDDLSKRLQEAKGMRNIIAHEYGKIDDEIVFEAVTEELGKDVRELIRQIMGCLR